MVSKTWEDGSDHGASARIRWLVLVLRYDDLLEPRSRPFSLQEAEPPIEIRRSDDDLPARWRDPSTLVVPDNFLSQAHARIESAGGTLSIKDAGSRNGTYLNGAPIKERALRDGDLIEVGHTLFCYRELNASIAAEIAKPGGISLGPTQTFSPEVALMASDLDHIAPSKEPVLVIGETGAGKEIIARQVHDRSAREGRFRAIDCGAIPEALFESTLFGHHKGAYTGAADARTGEIVLAHKGTLFLDEVSNMSAVAQAKLLRVLEDGQVHPLGSSEPTAVDVRCVAATNAEVLGDESKMRLDLVRRLAGYVARPPPLRRRREDLGVLSAHVLRSLGQAPVSISPPAARKLFNAPFWGNIRELRAALRSAALLARGTPIRLEHIQATAIAAEGADEEPPCREAAETARVEPPARPRGARPEPKAIEDALESTGGNVVRAAESLQTHPRQLYRWLRELSIDLGRFRP